MEKNKSILLNLENCTVYYRKALALERVCLEVAENEIISVIGANGAGKSTILKLIMGFVRPTEGSVLFNEKRINQIKPYKIAAMGISFCPEGGRLAPEMTVLENLEMGTYLMKDRVQIKENIHEIFHIFPKLEERKVQLAGTLSGGERQMLALGRALVSKPKMLLLDEPGLGLAPLVKEEIFFQIEQVVQNRNISIILVEQETTFGLKISERCYVLANGRIVLSGKSKELINDPSFRQAYLGLN